MFNLHLKYEFRRIWKNKLFSTINLLGLIIGIGSFFILFIYTANEKSFDQHFSKARNIYRVTSMPLGIDNVRWARSLGMIHEAVESIPEVEDATWFSHAPVGTIKMKNQQFQQKDILTIDKSFIDLFEVESLYGDLSEIIAPNTAFISERFANKYFKGENPIGKTIEIKSLQYLRDLGSFEIRGVVKNTHPKTHFNYEILLSQNGALSERYKSLPTLKIQWVYNYFSLKEGADHIKVEKALFSKFECSSLKQIRGHQDYLFSLTPLSAIHLYSTDLFEMKESSSKINIGLFITISLVILLISLFNFTNLTIARLIKRSQELELKKSIGAKNSQLIVQILTGVLLFCLFAIIIALGLIELMKPFINQLFQIEFSIYYNEPIVYVSILLVVTISIILISLFIVFFLSRKNTSMKRKGTESAAMRPLLIAQVAIVIILISSSLLVNKQVQFMLTSPLGFDKEQVLVLHLKDFSKDPSIFINEIKKQSQVESVGFTRHHFGYPTQSYQLESIGIDGNAALVFANYDYIKTMKIPLLKNWISPSTDTVRGTIINEHLYNRLMEKYGSMDALKLFQASQPLKEGQFRINIIGVAKDFNYNTAHQAIGDFAFLLDESRNWARFIHVRLNPGNLHLAMTKLDGIWKTHYQGQEFDYFFLDEQISSHYKTETVLIRILISFSLLGVFIAMIGISALSIFISQQRTKEIGVRKVNGAKITEVITMLNKDFVRWVVAAFVIATPIAWYTMDSWLENFAYKTELSWWIFVLAGGIALFIALATVSWQSWRAARRNPVEALRYE